MSAKSTWSISFYAICTVDIIKTSVIVYNWFLGYTFEVILYGNIFIWWYMKHAVARESIHKFHFPFCLIFKYMKVWKYLLFLLWLLFTHILKCTVGTPRNNAICFGKGIFKTNFGTRIISGWFKNNRKMFANKL